MTYWLRRISQVAAFIIFIVLLLQLQPLLDLGFNAEWFPQLSPLAGITTSIVARKLLFPYALSLVLLILTVCLGRFFCSWICPLGATIDVTDRIIKKTRTSLKHRLPNGRRFKFYLLVALLLAAVFGVQATGWFDPLSITPRSYSLVALPYADWSAKGVFNYVADFPAGRSISDPAAHFWEVVTYSYQPTGFHYHSVFLLIALAIVLLGLSHRRLWCRSICPLGALLSLACQFSLFKRKVSDKCTECSRCVSACNMNAITGNGKVTLSGECTLCLTCQHTCPTKAITFGTRQPDEQREEVDLSRRGIVIAGLGAAVSAPLLGINGASRTAGDNPTVIRPPGALPEQDFLAQCVRCGQCMRVCRTNGLQPAMFESGLEGMWTPRLVPRIGHCDRNCTLCGNACPSGAINPLNLTEKHKLSIGKARIDQTRCIPWVGYNTYHPGQDDWQDCNCAVCEEVCPVPTKAIRFNTFISETDGQAVEIRRPYIVEELCTGCGFCEKVCPLIGKAAVRVDAERGSASVPDMGELLLAFPEAIGQWERRGDGSLYSGKTRLYEYINGAGEPYLTYSFEQVAVARYSVKDKPEQGVKVDIWQFGNSDDAFGAYTMDRSGNPVDVGWEATQIENYIWLWTGPYYLRIEPEPGADLTAAGAVTFARAITKKLGVEEKALKPSMVQALPTNRLTHDSVRFFHESLVIQSIRLSDPMIDATVLGLSRQTQASLGQYSFDSGPARLLLIHFPSNAAAEAAKVALGQELRSFATDETVKDSAVWYNVDKNCFYVVRVIGKFLGAVFNIADKSRGIDLLHSALQSAVNTEKKR